MKIHVYMKNKEYDAIGYEYIEKFINNFSIYSKYGFRYAFD